MTPVASNSLPIQSKRRWILRTLIGLAVVASAAGLILLFLSAQTALTAERNLHAMSDAIRACHIYVEKHEGAWPQSLSDLDSLYPSHSEWIPRDAVHIDLHANPSELAQQDWRSFTGITVDDPVYLAYESELTALIGLLRRYHGHE